MSFKCDMCSECCRNLKLSPIYADLDDGTGKCKFLEGNLCSIYDDRPLICRVDDAYETYFKTVMTKEEYYQENYRTCEYLKNGRK